MQVNKLMNEVEDLDNIRAELVEGTTREKQQEEGFSIGEKAVTRLRSKPLGKGCVESTGRKRRKETIIAACAIHRVS